MGVSYARRLYLLLVIAMLTASPAESFAVDRGFYGQFEAGYSRTLNYRNRSVESKKFLRSVDSYAPIFSGELGYAFGNNLRAGLSVYRSDYKFQYSADRTDYYEDINAYKYGYIKGGIKVQSTAFMLNGYYDFSGFAHFTPYLTLGGGVSINKSSDLVAKSEVYGDFGDYGENALTIKGKTKASFAWSVGAGIKVPINDNWSLNMSAKYLDYGKSATSRYVKSHYSNGEKYTDEDVSSGTKLRALAIGFGITYKF